MTIFRISESSMEKVAETTFEQEKLFERRDLQRLIRADVSVLSPDLMVIAEEFGEWEDSNRRIDLLCLDKESHMVIVELKRTEDGGHMELQAIRYASMVSSMTFEELVGTHARFVGGDESYQKAESAILRFLNLESPSEAKLDDEVRIILVSANFSTEMTTAVLWLNKRGLDVTCIRMRPYRLDSQGLVDIQKLIPLPEAVEYETKSRAQQEEGRLAESNRDAMFRRFWRELIERSRGKTQLLTTRTGSKDQWIGVSVRGGFNLNFVVRRDDSGGECWINRGKNADDRNLIVFRALERQRDAIESAFGEKLEWQELPDSSSCRICKTLDGGGNTPEAEWPPLQDRLIEAMIRLEKAIKPPIQGLTIPKE